jgi:hypothetical protein
MNVNIMFNIITKNENVFLSFILASLYPNNANIIEVIINIPGAIKINKNISTGAALKIRILK